MDNQLYQDLIHYLTTLTFLDDADDKRKTHIRKISTQFIVKNHLLFKISKEGAKRVILRNQVEPILYNLHKDMSGAHLGVDAVIGKIKERYY